MNHTLTDCQTGIVATGKNIEECKKLDQLFKKYPLFFAKSYAKGERFYLPMGENQVKNIRDLLIFKFKEYNINASIEIV